jgi:hypothetical protein
VALNHLVAGAFSLTLARERACQLSPIALFSSAQQFLNPALFFFANFPWQGHNVRGVPKEP